MRDEHRLTTIAALAWPLALLPASSFLLWRRLNRPAPSSPESADRP